MLVEGEVGFAGLPGFGDFDEDAGDEPFQGLLAGEEADDTGSLLDLAVDVFAGIGGPQTLSVGFREGVNGEAFWQVLLGPGGESRLSFGVDFDEVLETFLGVVKIVGVEDASDVGGDFALEMLLGDVFLSVLLEVKLASLPRSAAQCAFKGRFEAAVGIGGDQIRNADAALLEAVEKIAPMDFCFRERTTDAEDHAFAVIAPDSVSNERGAVADNPIDADLVVGGIKGDIGDRRQRPGPPFLKLGVELLVEIGDLAGGDFEAAEIFHDFGNAAGAHPLDIHGGDGGFEGAFAA